MGTNSSEIVIRPDLNTLLTSRESCPLSVLSGPNNSGKSYLLKMACDSFAKGSHFFGCNRFFTLDHLQSMLPQPGYTDDLHHEFHKSVRNATSNSESNHHPLEQILRGLNNHQRKRLFDLLGDLMGFSFSLQHTIRDNDMTPIFIEVDGEPLKFTSTGTRLLLTLLGTCMDQRFDRLFIDEPEMGLSPRIQSILSRFFGDEGQRTSYMPHLKSIFIATHSHLFLDRKNIANNFIITKASNVIDVENVRSISQFHQLQFNLLGNDLEASFLPSAIVIVEGITDQRFLQKVLAIKFPNHRVTVVLGGSDGEIEKKLHTLREAFGDVARSPYHDRIFPVLDSQHSASRKRLAGKGIDESNITVWSKNGMEFHYPRDIMKQIFSCDDAALDHLDPDNIEINGIRKSKNELATDVCMRLTAESKYNDEFLGLLKMIERAVI